MRNWVVRCGLVLTARAGAAATLANVPAELPIGDNRPLARVRHALRGTRAYRGYRYVLSLRGASRERELLARVRTYCLFLGHARSGHSILGALLDAHPQIVLSDELDAVGYISTGFSRDQVLWLSVRVARDQAARQRQKRGRGGKIYSYHVPGQWQGRTDDVRVIGDSNAGATVRALSADPGLLPRVGSVMQGLDLRFIHVARNPYDNIGTMMLRSGRSFESAFERYFENWELIDRLRARIDPAAVHSVRHEELVTTPRESVAGACRFLGVEPSEEYLDACAGILYGSPARSRHAIEWSSEQRRRIDERIAAFDGLRGYSFEA